MARELKESIHDCPGCPDKNKGLFWSDETDTQKDVIECLDCADDYASAEKSWDDEADLKAEKIQDWIFDRKFGGEL